MHLEAVLIKSFRSIEETEIEDLGNLNVLIGRNNSGKSNILLAIHGFFSAFDRGEPITLNPLIAHSSNLRRCGDEYFGSEIHARFRLDAGERERLYTEIASQSPNMQAAVESLASDLRLSVELRVEPFQEPFAYVRSIALVTPGTFYRSGGTLRPLIEIGPEAAQELHARLRSDISRRDDIAFVQAFLESLRRKNEYEPWRSVHEETTMRGLRRAFPASRRARTDETEKRVNEAVRTSSASFEAAEANLNEILEDLGNQRSLTESPLAQRIQTFAGQESEIPSYAQGILRGIGRIRVLYLQDRRDPIGPAEAQRLLNLKITKGSDQQFHKIKETVTSLLGVNIEAYRDAGSDRGQTLAVLDVDDFIVQVNGSGVREALRMMLDFEFEQPDILLVEEPETHLHPTLESNVMRYLSSCASRSQVFATSHSTHFIDAAEMDAVYLVLREGATTVRRLDLDEAVRSVPRELGLRLSSVFMYERLVFVEGATDEEVLRELASKLELSLSKAGVGFVPMLGVRNLAQFAAEATITFLSRRQVKMWFLMDRDERDDSEVRRLATRLGKQAELHVLSRRELENVSAR